MGIVILKTNIWQTISEIQLLVPNDNSVFNFSRFYLQKYLVTNQFFHFFLHMDHSIIIPIIYWWLR